MLQWCMYGQNMGIWFTIDVHLHSPGGCMAVQLAYFEHFNPIAACALVARLLPTSKQGQNQGVRKRNLLVCLLSCCRSSS
jgi:hypothetical protein